MAPWRAATRLARRLAGALAVCAGLAAPLAMAQSPHVVQPGETLWGISSQHLRTPLRWPEVQQRNQVGEPRLLQPGKLLYFADGRLVPEGAAVVAAVEGRASRQRPGGPEQVLAPGTPILPGDVLVTGPDAFVTLGLPGGNRVVLPSQSALEVQAIDTQTIQLRLIRGRVESQVQKQQPGQQFEIRARSMGLGVRGTHFRVRDENGTLASEVIEGEVVVRQDRGGAEPPLVLRAGSGAVLLDGAGAQARTLLPAPQLLASNAPRADRALQFEPVAGAQSYRLQLARDERFLLPVHEQRGEAPAFTAPADLEAGFYQLRLTAFDANQLEGLPGDSTVYLPAAAGADTGRGSATLLSDGRVEIRWPGATGQRYAFELSRGADFSVLLIDEPAAHVAGMVVGPFVLGGRYHWRARPVGEGEAGAAGFGGSFEIPAR